MATETSHAIETMQVEDRRVQPSEFAAQANAQPEIYDETSRTFWTEGRDGIDLVRALLSSTSWKPPYAKWYLGGNAQRLLNCVDRHVEAGRGDKVAFYWEGEPGGRAAGRSRTPTSSATSSAWRTR